MASLVSRLKEWNLFPRLAWGLVFVFLAMHLIYNARHAHERMVSNAETFAVSTIDRAHAIAEVADANPELLRRLSTPGFTVTLSQEKPVSGGEGWPHSKEVEAAARALLAARGENREIDSLWFERRPRTPGKRHGREDLLLVMVLPYETGWLKVSAHMLPDRWRNPPGAALGTTMLALLLFLTVLWATRRFTRFLPRFAEAAERLGRSESTEPLALEGPREVRRAARAFNEMQQRVTNHVAERTAMLGAFSHDLRTLATRLSLRLDALADSEQRRKAAEDVAAMTRILDEALAFARDDASEEPRRKVDLHSLLQTLVDEAQDAADLRAPSVSSAMPDRVELQVASIAQSAAAEVWHLRGQPLALRRALSNVIENAVKYGGQVSVRLSQTTLPDGNAPALCVEVRDNGPGIPASDQDQVLKPYVRLEGSRNRDTGGTGLGLAIVANVVQRHGGLIAFENAVPVSDSTLFDQAFVVRIVLPVD